ncbi:MAG: copper amine oxidase N-terminal domain-containing protein [Armatimonadetes bacterium]|nr:copper amine oxidase N-terminal domain-containing protein [Armatimonadota bacterium]
MSKRIVLMSVLLTMVVSLAGISASADNVTINTSGATAFLYEGLSYLPLKSTASFLGAPLRWDAEKGQAIITYEGQDLVLTPNSLKALHAGQPVVLPSPSVVVDGVTYVPIGVFKKFYNIPVEWDKAKSEVKVKGPSGWGIVKASSRPPWHGGPPPWAPAWGKRGYGPQGHHGLKWSGKKLGNIKPKGSGKAKSKKNAQ